MPEPIEPHAQPIPLTGAPTWAPSAEDDSEAAPHAPRRQGPRDIIFGRDGLRAGWAVLLYATVVLLLTLAVNAVVKAVRHGAPVPHATKLLTAPSVIRSDYATFAVFAIAALVVALVERRRFARYGIGAPSPHRVGQFLAGAALGLGLLSLLILALRSSGLIAFDGVLLHGAAALQSGLLWFVAFLGVGFAEEFLTRGFLQFTLTRGLAGLGRVCGLRERTAVVIAFWLVALFFSTIFGLGHKGNPGESPIGLVSAGLIGLVFAFSLWRTGSLWWAIGFHAAWDWAQSFLFGTADSGLLVANHLLGSHPIGAPLYSGGLTGPEGSLYILGVIAIVWLTILLALPAEPGSYADPAWTPNEGTERR